MKVERALDLAAPREQVYALLMDPSRLGEWVTIHERFEEAPDELEQGSRMTQTLKVAGQRFTVNWTVTEDDRPARATWEGTGPARTSARGTRFSYHNEYELPGGAAGRVAARAVSAAAGREVERSLERLKGLLKG